MRRNIRLRKEYLYKKSLEGKEKDEYEKKQLIRRALSEGKALPTELYKEEESLRHEIDLEDSNTAKPKSHVDDEYASSGKIDPKICVTTSRDPSVRLKQFAKEVRLLFPNSSRVNRGNHKIEELMDACKRNDFTDVILLQEHRGEPTALIVSHLPYGPTAYFSLSNCVLRHDIENKGTISEAFPHLVFNNLNSSLGERLTNILKHLFPVPKEDSQRILTFSNDKDYISFRHHTFTKKGHKEVELSEIGPRFELRPFHIRLGTLEQNEAETEWALRPFMNTSRKRQRLA